MKKIIAYRTVEHSVNNGTRDFDGEIAGLIEQGWQPHFGMQASSDIDHNIYYAQPMVKYAEVPPLMIMPSGTIQIPAEPRTASAQPAFIPQMSIYPGEKPHYGTITEKQYLQLQELPNLLAALEMARAALTDPYCGEDDGERERPTVERIEYQLKKFANLGAAPSVMPPTIPVELEPREIRAVAHCLRYAFSALQQERACSDTDLRQLADNLEDKLPKEGE